MTSDEFGKNLISDLNNLHSQISIIITDLQKVLTASILNQEIYLKSKQIQHVSGQVFMLLYFGLIVQVSMSDI